jgi:23S rRNA pseudouridine1911/1915/1917 synthase
MRQARIPRLNIVFEDADIIVVDKPAGLLTSTVPGEKRPTLLAAVREYVARREPRARVGLIHRLDRDASGLLVFSKNHESYRSLKQQFFEHSARRIYFAAVAGKIDPPAGRIESRLVELVDGSVRSTRLSGKGERAVTHYKTIRQTDAHSLLRVTLETGRKHQIRVHLWERGTPILNDLIYGSSKPAGKMLLVAAELEFLHPRTRKRLKFQLEMPPEMRRLLRAKPS